MFGGLIINWVYPLLGYITPLSIPSIVISFSVALVILSLIAYLRVKNDFRLIPRLDFNTGVDAHKDKLLSLTIFPLIFPLLSILGTYLMEANENSAALMVMLGLIPAYIVTVIILRKRIHTATYPIAIWAISVALLLMNGLPSHYVLGNDVHYEHFAFITTLDNLHWSISDYTHLTNACLSTSLLPAIYEQILGINTFYVYKVVYNLIFSLIPLSIYTICEGRFGRPEAFLASLFFISQITFLYSTQSGMRQGIALFFFTLAVASLYDNETQPVGKKALFLIFLLSTAVSHYTTTYIFFFLLLVVWLISLMLNKSHQWGSTGGISGRSVLILLTFIFLWYSQLTVGFSSAVYFINNTLGNLVEFAVLESRGTEVATVIGAGTGGALVASWVVINWITIFLIGIGVLSSVLGYFRRKETEIQPELLAMMATSVFILALTIVLPYVATYNPSRVYIQMLVLLAPAFVIGGRAVSRYIKIPRASLHLIMLVLIAQLLAATIIAPKAFGVVAIALTREGYVYDRYYIHEEEVVAARWLDENAPDNSNVYCDHARGYRLSAAYVQKLNGNSSFFQEGVEARYDGYVYLSAANVVTGKVYPAPDSPEAKDISMYYYLLTPRNKIYSNGSSEIYR